MDYDQDYSRINVTDHQWYGMKNGQSSKEANSGNIAGSSNCNDIRSASETACERSLDTEDFN